MAAQEALRDQQKKDGTYQVQTGVSNTTSAFKTVEEEREGRKEAEAAQIQVFRAALTHESIARQKTYRTQSASPR